MLDAISLSVLVASFILSLTTFFQKGTPLYLRLCPFYLLATILVQQIGLYMSQHGIHNGFLYSSYSNAEFIFFFFVLRSIIQNKKVKSLLLFILIAYPLVAIFNIVYFNAENDFQSKTYTVGSILIVIFCIIYFWELFQLPKTINIKNEPSFWICTAILFSYVVTFPYWGLVDFMETAPKIVLNNLLNLLMIINILSYLLFTIAFLCRIKIRRSIS